MSALPLLDRLVAYALAIYGFVMICAVFVATFSHSRSVWEWVLRQWESWPERDIHRRSEG